MCVCEFVCVSLCELVCVSLCVCVYVEHSCVFLMLKADYYQ